MLLKSAREANCGSVIALGKDRIGLDLANQCVHISSNLARQVKKGLKRGQQELQTDEFQRSYSLALWASFLIQTYVPKYTTVSDANKSEQRDCHRVVTTTRLTKTVTGLCIHGSGIVECESMAALS